MGGVEMKIRVQYTHWKKNCYYSNIIWEKKYPMRGGKFPKTHPCYNNGELDMTVFSQPKNNTGNDGLSKLRKLGYWASCFPEGDGITLQPPDNKTPEDVKKDIETCWPDWKVSIK